MGMWRKAFSVVMTEGCVSTSFYALSLPTREPHILTAAGYLIVRTYTDQILLNTSHTQSSSATHLPAGMNTRVTPSLLRNSMILSLTSSAFMFCFESPPCTFFTYTASCVCIGPVSTSAPSLVC